MRKPPEVNSVRPQAAPERCTAGLRPGDTCLPKPSRLAGTDEQPVNDGPLIALNRESGPPATPLSGQGRGRGRSQTL
jgi:hypothetical protein